MLPYAVTITAGTNMTTSGAANQTVTAGSAITNVVYTANDGYYFPTTYSVAAVNGISVTRDSYTQITVSGTPTAAASITLTAPTAKTKPAAPTTPSATDCTTADNNDGKITGVTTAMEYKKSDATEWAAGTGSNITGLSNGTYYVRYKATDTTLASDNKELTIAAYTAPGQVAAPTFNPAADSYIGTQNVTISCATAGATIYYTTNGDTPTLSSTPYTSAISVSSTTTIKAIAVMDGMTDSSVSTATYTIIPPTYTLSVTAPTFDAVSVGYEQPAAKAITITSTGNSNATISSVALSGTNAGSFTLTNGTVSVTAGGTNTSYTIRPNAGLAAGTYTATITVTYNGEATATANVSFTVNALEVAETPIFSPVGGTFTSVQSVTISCATSGATIYYTTNGSTPTTSSLVYNSAIAVSTTTTIKAIAVKAGMTTSAVASATYTITDATVAVTSVTLNKTTADVEVGKTITLTATVLPANATDPTVTWTTNKAGVATVVNGVVTGVSAGTAKTTATAGGKSASCTVTVKDNAIAVTEITLNKSSITLTVGDSETLIATVTPDNATYKTVTWTTSDRNVAVVLNGTAENGTVSATGVGTATITAKAGDKTATCTVTVKSSGGGYTPVTPYYPSGGDNNNGTTNNNTNTNEPKIEGGSGASGWSNIASEISKTPEGGSVTIDMAGTTTLPASILNAVKGKDVDVVLDMGDGVKWTINGKDVDSVSGSIDLGVTVGKSSIPANVVNNVTGEKYNVEIHINYSGEFGFKATLTIDLRKQDAGLYANLYYYNPKTNAMEFVTSGKIKADGTVDLEFSHTSDYTIVVDDHDLGKELTATVSRTGNVKLSWTAQDGAESYNVYQAIYGKWVKLGTTSKTAYTVKSLTNNKTYKFMVRAKINGKLAAKADAMTLKVKVYYKPAPKATTADGRITLTWKEVPYATKYRIYVVKNGKYVKLKDTKKLKYSTSATVGKTYKFAVKAYINGKWTSVKASDIIKIKAK